MEIRMPKRISENYDSFVLMKFTSKYEYQQDFLDGKLYFNTTDFFSKCDRQGQGDVNEGDSFIIVSEKPDLVAANFEPVNGIMQIVVRDYSNNPNAYKPGTVFSMSKGENRNRKILSLYSLYANTAKNEISPFSDKMQDEFGKFGILILDHKQFFERIYMAISKRSQIHDTYLGFVDYMQEEDVHGFIDWHPFKKMPIFEYQNEFRITFLDDTEEPLLLDLGMSLRDIARPILESDLDAIYVKDNQLFYPKY